MKLRVVSDLHMEFWNRNPVLMHEVIPRLDTDKESVLCIPGDLGLLHRPETWLHTLKEMSIRFRAVVYVAGNHEFYHNTYFDRIDMIVKEVKLPRNVHFLENKSVVIDGVLFLGASLWTSLNDGSDLYTDIARRGMMDYRCIKWDTGHYITPDDTMRLHQASKRFIFNSLESNAVAATYTPDESYNKRVVITHHMPSFQCVSPRFVGDIANHCFCSDLDEDIKRVGPDLWLFGHTHDSHDSMLGETRLLCNPYGYFAQEVNPKYNPALVIEI